MERVGQQRDALEAWHSVRMALQVADRLGAEAGRLGKRLLGEASREAQPLQQDPEGLSRLGA